MPSILFEIKNGVGFITLNRPDKLNSFNREMALRLQSVLDECSQPSVRVVLITGAGKAFSAGQDLAEIIDPSGPGMDKILSEHFNPVIKKIRGLHKPVIAAVNGIAAGAGANIALCCDIVVASETASFLQAFSKIGLIPDSGGTYFLPRLIGWQKASALMMLGEKVSAQEAEQLGMIYKCYPEGEFELVLNQLAAKLATMPTHGLALTKKALELSFHSTLNEQLLNEDNLQQEAGNTEDFNEGVQAFLAKRVPAFKGS